MDERWVAREMSARVTRVAGYAQVVEVKGMLDSGSSGSARLSARQSDAITLGVGAEQGEEARGATAAAAALATCVTQAVRGAAAECAFDGRVVHPAGEGQAQWVGWQWRVAAQLPAGCSQRACKAALW